MPKRTNAFQELIDILERQLARQAASVYSSHLLPDASSGQEREVDIVIEDKSGVHPIRIGIEVIDHARPASSTWIEQISAKHRDLPIDKTIAVSRSGFYRPALAKAAALKIEALTVREATECDWKAQLGSPPRVVFENLVQWVRQHLVESGEIDGSTRGIWKLTDAGRARLGGTGTAKKRPASGGSFGIPRNLTLRDLSNLSKDEAKSRLLTELKQLTSTGFKHFCMELLQQLGFSDVCVTRRSGDGGIDGYGDFRQGAVSIQSAFQAKKWTDGAVGRPEIDKLRGAIQGDYDHGVFITTSRFSKGAYSSP